jgi:hypothetical protein
VRVRADGVWHEAAHDLMAPLAAEAREAKLRAKARALVGDREAALWQITRVADPTALAAWLAG